MTRNLALNLTHDGLALLVEATDGWRVVGEALFASEEFGADLQTLRGQAKDLGGTEFATRLVLPASQILYTKATASGLDSVTDAARVRSALDGATPYAVEDLAFDWHEANDVLNIAVVAKETLQEAENFARDHGFNPASFVTIPEEASFAQEPFLGLTKTGQSLAADHPAVLRSDTSIAVIGPYVSQPVQEPETEVSEPEQTSAEENVAEVPVAFSSRRARKPKAEPEADAIPAPEIAATPEPEPEPEHEPETEPEPDPEPIPAFTSIRARRNAEQEPAATPRLSGATREAPADVAPLVPVQPEPDTVREPVLAQAAARLAEAREKVKVTDRLKNVLSGLAAERGDRVEDMAKAIAAPAPVPPPVVAPPREAEDRSSLGAGKAAKKTGGHRLGLMLTAVLLLVLVAIAVWSSLFLPDRVSALFSSDDAPQEASLGLSRGLDLDVVEPAETTPPQSDPTVASIVAPKAPQVPEASPEVQVASLPTAPETTQPEVPQFPSEPLIEAIPVPEPGSSPDTEDPELADNEPNLPSVEDVVAFYAASGIWQASPARALDPDETTLEDLYIASIDPTIRSQDAIDLPRESQFGRDRSLPRPRNPTPPGATIVLDASGKVVPTTDGTMTPEGVLVYAGKPPVAPRVRPGFTQPTVQPEPEATPEDLVETTPEEPPLRPRSRPEGLVETAERAQLGGRTRAELSTRRPLSRPASVIAAGEAVRAAEAAAAQALADARALEEEELRLKAEAEAAAEASGQQSALAIKTSRLPKTRPRAVERRAARAAADAEERSRASTASTQTSAAARGTNATAVARNQRLKPTTTTPNSVSQQATVKNAINLSRVNLIGVYGSPSSRRALVRLSSGRYVKVKVGDRVDGGRVAAIGESELRYVKGGRNVVLRMPRG